MAAVVAEVIDRDWPHARLVRWANWARCPEPGAVGTSEGYLREPTAPGHEGVPTPEIEVTDKAVARMWVERPDYYKVFAMFYLSPDERSTYEIARTVRHNVARVEAMLRQARMLVGHKIRVLEREEAQA
jgi:hypothetical protein